MKDKPFRRVIWLSLFVLAIGLVGNAACPLCHAQQVADFLKVDSTESYHLLHESKLELQSTEVRQGVKQLQQMLYSEHHALHELAQPLEGKSAVGSQLSDRAVRLSGRLVAIRAIVSGPDSGPATVSTPEEALAAAQAVSAGDAPVFVCVIDVSGIEDNVAYVTPIVPKWMHARLKQNGGTVQWTDESISVQAEGLQLAATEVTVDGVRLPAKWTVIGKRLAWQPTSENELRLALPEATDLAILQRLASAGMDLGLLDALSESQRAPLVQSDNEPFYQLLSKASAASLPAIQNENDVWPSLSIKDSIVAPQNLVGRGFHLSAVVKQITQVEMEAGERGSQLGLKHYYLLHALMPLSKPIRLKVSETEDLTYQKQYPVVIATTRLPSGWEPGEDMRRWVDADCIFVKSWTYQSAKTIDSQASQWSPLMIAAELSEGVPPENKVKPWPIGWLLLIPVGIAVCGLLVAGIAGLRR